MPILKAEPDIFPVTLLEGESASPWWVLQTHARQEKRLCRALVQQQIPFYCPIISKSYRSPNGRPRTSYLPLFSNYVFIHGDEELRYRSLTTGCVHRCLEVFDAGQLVRELRQVKRLLDQGIPLAPEEDFPAGTPVRVTTGPMRGVEGRVLQRHGEQHLLVVVNFIQCGASLKLGDWEVERIA